MAGEFGISMLTERLMPQASEARLNQATQAKDQQAVAQGGASFKDTLNSALGDVNQAMQAADQVSRDFTAGKAGNLHDVMIAMEKAEVQLRTLTAVRNKVMDAYQEVMRMQV